MNTLNKGRTEQRLFKNKLSFHKIASGFYKKNKYMQILTFEKVKESWLQHYAHTWFFLFIFALVSIIRESK